MQVIKEAEVQVKQLNACGDELNKFSNECESFEEWLVDAEAAIRATQKASSELDRLQELKDSHKVGNSIDI